MNLKYDLDSDYGWFLNAQIFSMTSPLLHDRVFLNIDELIDLFDEQIE